MHHPVTLLRSQDALFLGLACTITLVPGGAIGVALKLKFP